MSEMIWVGSDDLRQLAVPIESLVNDPENANVHTERSLSTLAKSLEEFGQAKPIVVLDNGTIIAGNGTMIAAKRNGWTHIAVAHFSDESKARAYALADNRTSELSHWDEAQLTATMKMLSDVGQDFDSIGYSMDEVMGYIGAATEVVGDPVTAIAGQQRENEYGEKSVTGSQTPGEESHVRMVQLFFDEHTHPQFMEWIRVMAVSFGCDNVTDAVFMSVKHAYEGLE